MSVTEIFTDIYNRRAWGGDTGGGSMHCEPYLRFVEKAIRDTGARSVLDIGCGTGLAAAAIDWQGASYVGIDVVCSAIRMARERRIPGLTFEVMDAITDALPSADLVLVKEVFQHLENASILAVLEKLQRYPALLVCTAVYGEIVNKDIETGALGRTLDLSKAPFDQPAPDEVVPYHVGSVQYVCELRRTK